LGFGSDQWVLPASAHNETVAMLYTYCFYWSTLLLSTIGDVPLPVERSEYVFVLFDYMIGMLFSIISFLSRELTNCLAGFIKTRCSWKFSIRIIIKNPKHKVK
jgi:hypothetical protein